MTANDAKEIATFAYELGFLKMLPRGGWLRAGVSDGESVAAHSWRVAVLAFILAVEEGADPNRAAALGLFHDVPETRCGDIAATGKAYVVPVAATEIIADQTMNLPVELADRIRAIVAEHESAKQSGASTEARCSRDADKLDLLLQAREYQEVGRGLDVMDRFIDSMIPLITTTTGKALVDAALKVTPSAWWSEFGNRFGTPAQSERPIRPIK